MVRSRSNTVGSQSEATTTPNSSRHRRAGASLLAQNSAAAAAVMEGFVDITLPTTTTKALLVSIVCPRRIGHRRTEDEASTEELPPKEPEATADDTQTVTTDVETASASEHSSQLDGRSPSVMEDMGLVPNQAVGTQARNKEEGGETPKVGNLKKKIRLDDVGREDRAGLNNGIDFDKESDRHASSLTTTSTEGHDGSEEDDENADHLEPLPDIPELQVPEMPSMEGTARTESGGIVTAEEIAAITPGESEGESEINMEELLRISFDNLLKEWHLLNVPTYSLVNHHTVAPDEIGTKFEKDDAAWIFLQAMVRPNSLGIVLERMERIGVGDLCGTISIFKVEFCKTASPYSEMKEMSFKEKQLTESSVEGEESALSSQRGDANVLSSATGSFKAKEKDTSSVRTGTDETENNSIRGNEDRLKEEQEEAERVAAERAIEAARLEWKNAATRLRIEQVREQIVEQAAFTFDYIALVSIASLIAAIGLITNNTVVIVASMLVSPIMGPVLGLTFGSRIRDWPLVQSSLKHECISLLGCVVAGIFVGICSAYTPLATETWPTNEMSSRGDATGLLVGIGVAIPSGMGVCLGILGGNTSSLVGVAISASLLPPAVNSGICFVYAMCLATGSTSTDSQLDAADFAEIGAISFALTVVNIVCIWIAGLAMFEIKEVAPYKSKSAFWTRDLRVARELNKSHEKPKPVNFKTIEDGLLEAARGKNKGKPDVRSIKKVKVRPPSNKNKVAPTGPQPLVATWALSGGGVQPARSASASALPNTEPFLWDQLPFHEVDDNPDDDVQYVGLEDMASLLGFDKDDDEYEEPIDHAAIARKLGHGRYI